ncbi:PTK7 [Cervus elaphus hippelaphus]|uniref:PTK7 n=1 Tax=Cervus elaphus hippelaphus TaxID=46360 RepID=A0A212D533_CEREH|nr:PTK7 [Cervus elaphus hippelaphus]
MLLCLPALAPHSFEVPSIQPVFTEHLCAQAAVVFIKEPSSQDALQGRRALLRCEVEAPGPVHVFWLLDGAPVQDTERRFTQGSSLSFAAVDRLQDSGAFQCVARDEVTGEEARSANASFNIKWLETGPVVLKHPASEAAIQPLTQVTLRCHIDGHPRATVFANGSLQLTQVRPRNAGVYRCIGQGQRGPPVVLEATLHLAEIEDMPPFEPRVFTAGSEERVACPPPQGLPEPSVWWEHAGARLPDHGRVYQQGHELVFASTAESDAGVYTCHAANLAGQRRQDVNITVATVPTWLEKPQDSQLEEGKPGYLHCLTQATPKPTVFWYRNQMLISEDSRFEVFKNGTLRINSVEVYDGTWYRCVSSTPAGSIEAQARVQVLEKLKFTPPPRPQQCMEFDKEATVPCSATGREKPTIKWVRAGGPLQNGQPSAEIQEEVALTSLGSASAATSKRHSASDKLHFPRASLQPITTLGKSEFGEVFLAKAQGLEEGLPETLVLVKSLQSRDEQQQLDFRREFEMFGKLNHANVVRLLGLCREAEPHYMVLEYVDLVCCWGALAVSGGGSALTCSASCSPNSDPAFP